MDTLLSDFILGNLTYDRSFVVFNAIAAWATPAMHDGSAISFRRPVTLRRQQSLSIGILIWDRHNVLIWHRIMPVFIWLDLSWESVRRLLVLSCLGAFLLLFRFFSLHARAGSKGTWFWATTLSAWCIYSASIVINAFSKWLHIYLWRSLLFSQQTFLGSLTVFFLWSGTLLIQIFLRVYLA